MPGTPELAAREVKTISPSGFGLYEVCRLRWSLASAKHPHLLRSFPARELGTAYHQLIEEASRGQVAGDESSLGVRFDEIVAELDDDLRQNWLTAVWVPMGSKVRDYGLRRGRAVTRAMSVARTPETSRAAPMPFRGVEVFLEARSGLIRGKADSVWFDGDDLVITDEKSGRIRANDGSVQDAYETQLLMYAAMLAESSGEWPDRLELVSATGDRTAVAVNHARATGLLDHAIEVLTAHNESVAGGIGADALAAPSAEGCRFCDYRPGCARYHKAATGRGDAEGWPSDVFGPVAEHRLLGNGGHMLLIGDPPVRVRGLSGDPDRHPDLTSDLTGSDFAGAYDVERLGGGHSFGEEPRTVIYAV